MMNQLYVKLGLSLYASYRILSPSNHHIERVEWKEEAEGVNIADKAWASFSLGPSKHLSFFIERQTPSDMLLVSNNLYYV
jgi:hypothetical protein